MFKKTVTALAAATLVSALTACGGGDDNLTNPPASTFFTSDGTNLSSFRSTDRLLATNTAITGLTAGTTVLGLDFNPNGGALVALGSNGQAYTINTATAVARPLGSRDTVTSFANKTVDIDFNPRAQNVFRVITNVLENYRQRGNVPSNSAAPTATPGMRITTGSSCSPSGDCGFRYATGDVNAGKTLAVTGVAYINSNLNGGTVPATTVAYVIDVQNNVLARLGSDPASGTANAPGNPNEGVLTTIGALGVDLNGFTGFDIDTAAGNTGYVAGTVGGDYRLFTVNLATGALSDVGLLPPSAAPITAFAVVQR